MSTEELDPNMEIEGTDDMGGFEMPPEGSIDDGTGVLMELTGEVKNCGENDKTLGFEMVYVENPSAKTTAYCKTTTVKGLQQLVGIGNNSGAFDRIEAKRKKAGKSSIRNDKGTVIIKTLIDLRFQEQFKQEVAGCQIVCSIKHKPAEAYTDKEGHEKEGFPQANVYKTGKPGAKAAVKAVEAGEAAGGSAEAGENSDWD